MQAVHHYLQLPGLRLALECPVAGGAAGLAVATADYETKFPFVVWLISGIGIHVRMLCDKATPTAKSKAVALVGVQKITVPTSTIQALPQHQHHNYHACSVSAAGLATNRATGHLLRLRFASPAQQNSTWKHTSS